MSANTPGAPKHMRTLANATYSRTINLTVTSPPMSILFQSKPIRSSPTAQHPHNGVSHTTGTTRHTGSGYREAITWSSERLAAPASYRGRAERPPPPTLKGFPDRPNFRVHIPPVRIPAQSQDGFAVTGLPFSCQTHYTPGWQ